MSVFRAFKRAVATVEKALTCQPVARRGGFLPRAWQPRMASHGAAPHPGTHAMLGRSGDRSPVVRTALLNAPMTLICTTQNLRAARPCAVALIIATTITAASAQGDLDWRRYSDRAGTRVDYPAALFSQTRAPAENGVTLARPDGDAHLRVFTVANTRGDTPRRFLTREFPFDRSTLSYDRIAPNFFAVSARREGRILYTRCNFATRIHCIELGYPQAEKRAFDSVVTRISLSLRPRG
jgi:hypothetical protein